MALKGKKPCNATRPVSKQSFSETQHPLLHHKTIVNHAISKKNQKYEQIPKFHPTKKNRRNILQFFLPSSEQEEKFARFEIRNRKRSGYVCSTLSKHIRHGQNTSETKREREIERGKVTNRKQPQKQPTTDQTKKRETE